VVGWQLTAARLGGGFAVEAELGASEVSQGQGEVRLGSLSQTKALLGSRQLGLS